MTIFVVKDFSMPFLTNLQSRCRAAELGCCGEVSSSFRGDDDRRVRREEQRPGGLAKVVNSNLGPGLSKHRVVVPVLRGYRVGKSANEKFEEFVDGREQVRRHE